jgi:hypothetical protein
MFRRVLILSSIAVYSLLVAGCATDQAPPTPAPINDPPRTEKQVLSPPAKEARGAVPHASVREPPRVDRFERPASPPPAAPVNVPPRVERPAPPGLSDAEIIARIIAASQVGLSRQLPLSRQRGSSRPALWWQERLRAAWWIRASVLPERCDASDDPRVSAARVLITAWLIGSGPVGRAASP